ncbi:Dynein heavy chain 14 axonemal [Dissostichus eleginoides]|uniref:Dynein heavy chain 14 axonemal n=1 Tax=Dissostichus eleginoides TaxID=100907 RepID=A0AAD9CKG7_DISEL|nr:Dynein heavy chain 14 axonemal [Dissostichus eleginoides]
MAARECAAALSSPVPCLFVLRQSKPITKHIDTWPDDALSRLQDCFSSTEWSIFENQDLSDYTRAVLSYISYCAGNVTVRKRTRVFPNQKPWMTGEVRLLIRERNATFRSGDREKYSTARGNLKRGIKAAKESY